MAWELTVGECAETMRAMPADSVDAIVCDPPYGLRFMGKEFDSLGDGIAQQEWHRAWTTEAFRVLKPGGYLMAFGGTRTYHRLVLAVEQSGFDAHGVWAWCYGSGFPKSHSIGKAIDKAAGAEREVIGEKECGYQVSISKTRVEQGHRPNETAATTIVPITAPATADAKKWDGWGTALKPAWEPIVIASKGTGRGLTGSEFFYCPKAPKRERNAGLDGFEVRRPDDRTVTGMGSFEEKGVQPQRNHHPTVKPIAAMRWLIRAASDPGSIVLDPFVGSGTTGCAAILEGRDFQGIEMNAEYADIANHRCRHWELEAESTPKSLF